MTKEILNELVTTGREIEFDYKGKQYSITYYNDNRKKYISFCGFYKETLDVSSVDELWNSTYKNISVKDMILSINEDDYSVY
jgi:hypothetical protein